jgi:hypothetical protein
VVSGNDASVGRFKHVFRILIFVNLVLKYVFALARTQTPVKLNLVFKCFADGNLLAVI